MGGRLGTLRSVKVAVTLGACVMLTVQEPVPLHPAPRQLSNVESLAATAVSVTLGLELNGALHVLPQVIPVGLEVTVPLPVPSFTTVRVKGWTLKMAVTVRAWVTLTVHGLVPLHPANPVTLQPANIKPLSAVAVSVTLVLKAKRALHVLPQSIPAGLLVT